MSIQTSGQRRGDSTANDATYIRDCLLLRDLTEAIAEKVAAENSDVAEQDSAAVIETFDWIIRNVSLTGDSETRPPLGLFDVLMTGRGSPKDRAWIFAEALRQRQFDAFLVMTDVDSAEDGGPLDTAKWLVAVALDDNSMLFDMTSGLPVTTDESPDLLSMKPAPISSLKDHERWKDSSAQIVAQIAAFAPRMLVLQQQLAVEDSAVLYEELSGGVSEIRPVLKRVEAAGDGLWKSENISVWSYPETNVCGIAVAVRRAAKRTH